MQHTISCPVKKSALLFPNGVAVWDDLGHVLTFAQLDNAIDHAIKRLRSQGIKPGDIISVLSWNSISVVVLFHAAMRLGVTLLSLNCRLTGDDHKKQLSEASCRWCLYSDEFASCAEQLGVRPLPLSQIVNQEHHDLSGSPDYQISVNQDALIIFTSGSQGRPKGIVLTAGNLYYNALGCASALPLLPDDVWLAVLPFFHIGGISIPFRTALAGCASYCMTGFDPQHIAQLASRDEITILSLVPTMLTDLIKIDDGNVLSQVRAIVLGGDRLDDPLRREIIARRLPVLTSYGMTETASMITLLSPGDPPEKLATSGKVLPFRQLIIVGDDGVEVPDGKSGKILVKGEVLFSRYVAQFESPFDDDGWFATGDMGWIDRDGCLIVTGRADRVIISGGENIDLNQIEQALSAIDGIIGAVVLSCPDKKWGARPVAFVETSDAAASTSTLMSALEKTLPRIMLPDKILIVEALPHTAAGKIDRQELARRHSAELSG